MYRIIRTAIIFDFVETLETIERSRRRDTPSNLGPVGMTYVRVYNTYLGEGFFFTLDDNNITLARERILPPDGFSLLTCSHYV